MLSQQDLKQIAQKGITQEQIENQLNEFKTGFPFLKLEAAAGIGRGIIAPDAAARKQYEDIWNAYKAEGKRVVKFVPASGAASRMFKNMFAFVDADYDVPTLLSTRHSTLPARRTRVRASRHSLLKATTRLWLPIC